MSGLLTAAMVAGALAIAACAGDEDTTAQSADPIDRAFAVGMVPHHDMAIEMAEIAQQRGSHAEIRALADEIVAAQSAEIAELKDADSRLAEAGVKTGDLGMTDAQMGMDMNMDMLSPRKGFDRMFIDMMILHHQGAIRMARAQLADGKDRGLRTMAEAIIAAQSREIEKMNDWRRQWYGAASPSGTVPEAGDGGAPSDDTHGMGHSG